MRLFSQWWCIHEFCTQNIFEAKRPLQTCFNYILFDLDLVLFFCPFFFKCLFFFFSNLSHFKNIRVLSQCRTGNFDSPSNIAHFSLNEKIPPHLKKLRVRTSVEAEEDTWGTSLHARPVLTFFPCHLLMDTVRSMWILTDGCWMGFFVFSCKRAVECIFCYKVGK